MKKKTLILGASDNPARYSFLAIHRLRNHGHPVLAIGKRHAHVAQVEIITEKNSWEDVDTVTIYLHPDNQPQYYQYILSLKPRRIIFNPGAENAELSAMCRENGILPVDACTLVLLSTGQY
jgi:predicted CoA-binding protein